MSQKPAPIEKIIMPDGTSHSFQPPPKQPAPPGDTMLEKARVLREQFAYLDDVAERFGDDRAREIAKANAQSIYGWGQAWLDAHPPELTVEKSAPATMDVIMKAAETRLAKAKREMETFVERAMVKYKLDKPRTMVKLVSPHTPEYERFSELYEAHEKAHTAYYDGDPHALAAPYVKKRNQAWTDAENLVKQYQLDHYIEDTFKARAHLEKYSPAYQSLMKAYEEHNEAADAAYREATVRVMRWHEKQAALRTHAEEEALEKARDARKLPAERKLDEHLAKVAAQRNITAPEALVWGLSTGADGEHNDPTIVALYETADDERNAQKGT